LGAQDRSMPDARVQDLYELPSRLLNVVCWISEGVYRLGVASSLNVIVSRKSSVFEHA